MRQLFFENVIEGTTLPPLVKSPTTRQLVQWAGASRDFEEQHYDKDVAISKGLPGVVVHGALKAAFLGQLITDWMGDSGFLKELQVTYLGPDFPGLSLTCMGIVTKKYCRGDENLVECKIWIENEKHEETTRGMAVVSLPLKLS